MKLIRIIFVLAVFAFLMPACGVSREAQTEQAGEVSPTVAPIATPTPTPVPTPTPTPTPEPEDDSVKPGDAVYRINCGSMLPVGEFEKDQKYWAGNMSDNESGVEDTSDADALAEFITIPDTLKDPAPLLVYNSLRWVGAGFFGYRFDGLEPGREYLLRLHQIELRDRDPGIFNVRIGEEIVMEGLSVLEVTGGMGLASILELSAVANEDGKIDIDIVHVKTNAVMLAAIEVIAG